MLVNLTMAINQNRGHRSRLRDKVLKSGLVGFLDYEIIELLLTIGTPRRDCKQQAKQLLKKFGSLSKVLYAPIEELEQVKGVGPKNIWAIIFFRELITRYQADSLNQKLVLTTTDEIAHYLISKIGHEKQEHFILLFFNTKGQLITHTVSKGILDASIIHPREVFKPAIDHRASYVIIAHNHPSGDPTPSEADILSTHKLVQTGKIIGIPLVDHIIVSSTRYISLKQLGHIR